MDIITAIIIYLLIWWTALFAVLPFGNAPEETVTKGHATSAPANPRLKKKFIVTTLVSVILWAIIVGVITYSKFSFYDWVYDWE